MGRTLLRHFLLIPQVTPGSVARFLKRCATSIAPTTSHLLLPRMNSTARRATTTAMSGHCCRAVFPRSRRRKKKTARAGFTSASIGSSTKPKASRKGVTWRIMSSPMPLRRECEPGPVRDKDITLSNDRARRITYFVPETAGFVPNRWQLRFAVYNRRPPIVPSRSIARPTSR